MTTSEKVEKVFQKFRGYGVVVEEGATWDDLAKEIVEALEKDETVIGGTKEEDTEIYVLRQILDELQDIRENTNEIRYRP